MVTDSQLTCSGVFSGTVSRLGKSCLHEAQRARDSVADLAHTVPPVVRVPTFRHIALPVTDSNGGVGVLQGAHHYTTIYAVNI